MPLAKAESKKRPGRNLWGFFLFVAWRLAQRAVRPLLPRVTCFGFSFTPRGEKPSRNLRRSRF